MAKFVDVESAIDAINTETNNLAARVDAIIAQIGGGISATDADTIVTQLTAVSDRLKGIGADQSNPIPTEPPPATPGS